MLLASAAGPAPWSGTLVSTWSGSSTCVTPRHSPPLSTDLHRAIELTLGQVSRSWGDKETPLDRHSAALQERCEDLQALLADGVAEVRLEPATVHTDRHMLERTLLRAHGTLLRGSTHLMALLRPAGAMRYPLRRGTLHSPPPLELCGREWCQPSLSYGFFSYLCVYCPYWSGSRTLGVCGVDDSWRGLPKRD
jgi:hypothetical protein